MRKPVLGAIAVTVGALIYTLTKKVLREQSYKHFFKALHAEDIVSIRREIEKGFDIDTYNYYHTLLMYAIYYGKPASVRFLIESDANMWLAVKDRPDLTSLKLAVIYISLFPSEAQIEILQILLEKIVRDIDAEKFDDYQELSEHVQDAFDNMILYNMTLPNTPLVPAINTFRVLLLQHEDKFPGLRAKIDAALRKAMRKFNGELAFRAHIKFLRRDGFC